MTQEEKIKRYDEALERAKKLQETCDSQAVVGWCEYLFPELKESRPNGCIVLEDFNGGEGFYKLNLDYLNEKQVEEIEEMVRTWNKESKTSNENIKNCIGMCLTDANGQRFKDYNTTLKDCLDWLRSQGEKEEPQAYKTEDDTIVTYSEKKGYNSVRLKFKVGDFVVNDYCMGRVMELTDDAYLLDTEQGIPFSCENNAHLWTVEDAKPGDVLSGKINGDNYILIFKQVTDGWVETYGHYYDVVDRFCAPSQLFCRDYQGTFAPATKEQRDLLFSKMKEAGYEWDSEKKELKKIEQKEEDIHNKLTALEFSLKHIMEEAIECGDTHNLKADADVLLKLIQNPTWSEEDEHRVKDTIYFLDTAKKHYASTVELDACINWLKSLKQRIGGEL